MTLVRRALVQFDRTEKVAGTWDDSRRASRPVLDRL